MRQLKKTKGVLMFILLILFTLSFISCDKAKDSLEDNTDKVMEKSDKLLSEAAERAEKSKDKIEKKTVELIGNDFLEGTWTGILDSRKTTLVISKQDGNSIMGKITINYREPINQEIIGTFDPSTNKLFMEDQLHSRYKGKYNGELSEDGNTYSGTFTTLVDKNSYEFNLEINK